ncbi:hypothetical protein ACED34_00535 [Vibrio splendidus]|uniref:hypothetical protein n=1 Tax=Vibrio splendidus TaxID=29497 RepID=UPI00352C60E1
MVTAYLANAKFTATRLPMLTTYSGDWNCRPIPLMCLFSAAGFISDFMSYSIVEVDEISIKDLD